MTGPRRPFLADVDLSKHTRPGRLGFVYAIELNYKYYYYTEDGADNGWNRWQRNRNFYYTLSGKFGKEYQTHWIRKQHSRRWYRQIIEDNTVTRYCFKTQNDRLHAWLLLP
jgi:hypothetical protein